jgi:hypothetical protein
MDDCAEQPVKQDVSRIRRPRFGARQSAMHDAEVAFEPEFRACSGDLSGRI